MSLPVRLTLAFMALVSLVVVVGLTSFVTTRQLGSAVAMLRSKSGVDLRYIDLDAVSLEIEGTWSPTGHFVASDIEVHPGQRRPKLRGKIQARDEESRTITLYGTQIHVRADTTFGGSDSAGVFEHLRVGDHIEVICLVEDGVWVARDIRNEGIKQSDKVKGSATAARLDGASPEEIEIHGLVIVVEAPGDDPPESTLGRIETSTQMALALNEFQASAYELVGATRARDPGDRPLPPETVGSDTGELLRAAAERFEYHLRNAEKADGEGVASRWLRPLTRDGQALSEYADVLIDTIVTDPARARAYLDGELDPFVEGKLLPLVYGYLGHAQERMSEQLSWIVARSSTTTRVALATSVVAALAACVLGFLVWRSISGPIQVLHAAAVRIGEGHLDTRVELGSKDEIGVLANAFNTMAHELGATTVSVENLEGIFDSMAGALIIFGPDGKISNMNRAAIEMLGYQSKEDLLDATYDQICEVPGGESAQLIGDVGEDGILVSAERVFIRKDGTRLPVSFSGTQLRRQGGPLRGYVCVAQDLSGLKGIEDRLRASLSEKELLLREVHHRVKNNLQVICSMLALQAGDVADPGARAQFMESESRIRSMALIHEQLYGAEDFSAIDMRAYLDALTANLLRSFARAATVSIDLQVAEVSIDMDKSLACGLIVSELVMRSLKYAFDEERSGTITVRLAQQGESECVLLVEDDGRALGEGCDGNEEALGMSLVVALAQQLNGALTVKREERNEVRVVFLTAASDVMVAV